MASNAFFQEHSFQRAHSRWHDGWGTKQEFVAQPTPSLPLPKDWDPPEYWVYQVRISLCWLHTLTVAERGRVRGRGREAGVDGRGEGGGGGGAGGAQSQHSFHFKQDFLVSECLPCSDLLMCAGHQSGHWVYRASAGGGPAGSRCTEARASSH